MSILARQKGFEPPTPSLGGRCSIQLSYWRVWNQKELYNKKRKMSIGNPSELTDCPAKTTDCPKSIDGRAAASYTETRKTERRETL